MMNNDPYYIVYAATYDPAGSEDVNEPCFWIESWLLCGNSLTLAVKRLNAVQQIGYDFCGISVEFAS